MYSTSLNQAVGSLVEKNSLLLSEEAIVSDAVIAMREKGVSSVLVTSDHSRSSHTKFSETEHTSLSWESAHSIEGIVTERDITRGVCIHDVLSKEFKILHLMTSPLLTINPNSSIEIAANLMLQKKVRHLIVVDGNKTVGIVTATNFIDYLNEQMDPVDPNSNMLKTLKDEIWSAKYDCDSKDYDCDSKDKVDRLLD